MTERYFPRIMSTQHPDNASIPFFASGGALTGEEEVREAYYAYSTLGCDEQMWDHEGKEVDVYVVPKLFSHYASFFRKKKLGKHVFLTLRVPNPSRERSSAKGLLEILESIPRSFDVAKHFYRQDIAPIFEIILPMTTQSIELDRIWHYYREFVVGKENRPAISGDITLKEWIGEFAPATLNVIPLIEDKPSLMSADHIVEGFLKGKDLPYQRVFLARSDPALTYGSATAVLMLKIALHRLHNLEKRMKIPIYPIVGVGSAPFRGNFKPTNVLSRTHGYPSVQTFTVQSAFKFDYPEELVKSAIAQIKRIKRWAPIEIDDEVPLTQVIERLSKTYSRQIEQITRLVNHVSQYVPPRRKRKLHVGLFGYTRAVAGKRLPRAIGFCASLYSIGIPPELFGLSALRPSDIKMITEYYPNFVEDMSEALRYFDPEALKILPPRVADDLKKTIRVIGCPIDSNLIHQSLTRVIRRFLEKNDEKNLPDLIAQAARERRFLG